ncbi:hypothetical protein T10_6429 [Trichinella papuae]|uniref:Uncharacterized protein n=1 Tax=Trichinella papuae TaxID=268474 RepID=A0A0V1MZS4_9BILA|nr:hypothetical protein T10_6429 [Trichinella papuae]
MTIVLTTELLQHLLEVISLLGLVASFIRCLRLQQRVFANLSKRCFLHPQWVYTSFSVDVQQRLKESKTAKLNFLPMFKFMYGNIISQFSLPERDQHDTILQHYCENYENSTPQNGLFASGSGFNRLAGICKKHPQCRITQTKLNNNCLENKHRPDVCLLHKPAVIRYAKNGNLLPKENKYVKTMVEKFQATAEAEQATVDWQKNAHRLDNFSQNKIPSHT